MKILKHGKYIKPAKCSRCGCLMLYDSNDIKSLYKYVHTERVFLYNYIKCPECSNYIVLDEKRNKYKSAYMRQ